MSPSPNHSGPWDPFDPSIRPAAPPPPPSSQGAGSWPEGSVPIEEILEELSGLDGAFGQAEADTGLVPPGVYQAKVVTCEVRRSKRTLRPQLAWEFEVLGPKCRGRHLYHTNGITEQSVQWLKGDLLRMGLQLAHLHDLPTRSRELIGAFAEVRVVHKPGDEGQTFVNLYINKRIQQPGALDPSSVAGFGEQAAPAAEPFSAEQTPF